MPANLVASTVRAAARSADAGACFEPRSGSRVVCLPGLINIGVQKAGTGELQTWLATHPSVTVHGGEVHFFDSVDPVACSARQRGLLRLRYARFLWRRRPLSAAAVRHGHLLYEKTPAYFDQASPKLVACAVPAVRLVVMLREPVARARSAYAMCQREMGAPWCRAPFGEAIARVLVNESGAPRASRRALRRAPHLRRMLLMGQYAAHLRRWLDAFAPARVRVLWLEQFQRDPFACMLAIERFAELAPHNYRAIASRNAAGFYVVGHSKSSSASTSNAAATAVAAASAAAARVRPPPDEGHERALAMLRAYYAPWQRRLRLLLDQSNTSLLDAPPSPLPLGA